MRTTRTTTSAAPRRLASTLAALAVGALAAVLGLVATAPAGSAADPVRIMALGDSITGSPGCWRALLWQRLQAAGITDTDFVGTLSGQGCGFAYDGENEGHGGFLVTNVAAQGELVGWLDQTDPDVVLMHFGTNDVWSNRSTTEILAAYTTLVDQMRANNPDMVVLVAQIIPVAPATCAECPARTVALNQAIPAWAAGLSTSRSPVTVVDHWTGWDPAVDTYDGVHPDEDGIAKMADRWYAPLAAVLTGSTPEPTTTTTVPPSYEPTPAPTISAPSTSPSPTPTATPTPPPTKGCTATWTVQSRWPGGFVVGVRVTAGSSALTSWTVTATLPDGQVANAWSSQVVQSGSTVTFTPAAWNAGLPASASTDVGFQGTGAPEATSVTCTGS